MKKFFIVTLALLFVTGVAYAVEYEWSGMINTRGTYISNSSGFEEDAGNYMDYDMEFDSTLWIRPTDKSFINLNWEIHDEGFGDSPTDSGDKTGDDQIAFKRAFGGYTFDTGTSVDFGLMTGGAWATAFGDNADGFYRIKVVHPTGFGPIIGILEKNAENGSNYSDPDGDYAAFDPGSETPYDAEADDKDTYALALVTKVGDINIKPLLKYVTAGDLEPDEANDLTVTAFDLGLDGSFGAIGFEAEFIYVTYAFDTEDGGITGAADDEDYSETGAYVNAWMGMDALEVGGMLAYGSYDKDGGVAGAGAGFGFGVDFGPGFWVMDWERFGSGDAEYYAATLAALYGTYTISDAMSLYGCIEYMMSNEEETAFEGATGTIFNAKLTYKLADNVTYDVLGAYGQFTFDDWEDSAGTDHDKIDSDPFTRVAHRITVSF